MFPFLKGCSQTEKNEAARPKYAAIDLYVFEGLMTKKKKNLKDVCKKSPQTHSNPNNE